MSDSTSNDAAAASSGAVSKRRKTAGTGRRGGKTASASSGRGGKVVYSTLGNTDNMHASSLLPNHEHVIVHLNTSCDNERNPDTGDVSSSDVKPYDASDDFSFIKESVSPRKPIADDKQENYVQVRTDVQTLLREFQKRTIDGDWPSNTNVHCHWCCHAFEGCPIAIPTRVDTNSEGQPRWEVCGCFCSFQCAAAYNFDNNDDSDDMWENYALLNRMYSECNILNVDNIVEDRVFPAPPRQSLKMFGGYMSIEEFRSKTMPKTYTMQNGESSISRGNIVDLLRYPMMFVAQQIDEINEADITQPLKFIPVDQEHINKVKEKLQLKRTKPLINSNHTLDRVMNLRIE